MDRPFRRPVTLTDEERRRFQELVSELGSGSDADEIRIRLGWPARLRMALLRRRSAMVLLLPIGLLVAAVAIVTWWPLGLVGAGLLGLGVHAANGIVADGLRRLRPVDRLSGSDRS